MKRVLLAVSAALGAVWLASGSASACSTDLQSVSRIAHRADRIVLGSVIKRVGIGLDTYTIEVERVIKGPSLPTRWVINDAGASDCGMPRLNVGQRVVLEYFNPGRVTTGPWFYAWTIKSDGTLAYSDSHEPPLPETIDNLLALYAAAGLPDTATEASGPPAGMFGSVSDLPPNAVCIAIAGLIGGYLTWRRTSVSPATA
jgi:hypothetical protein